MSLRTFDNRATDRRVDRSAWTRKAKKGFPMRKIFLALAAVSLAIPVSMTVPADKAEAKKHRYYSKAKRTNRCRYSSGTTGLVAGGVGGALVGNAVGGGLLGTVAGGVGGALGGRAIDRSITAKKRCR